MDYKKYVLTRNGNHPVVHCLISPSHHDKLTYINN